MRRLSKLFFALFGFLGIVTGACNGFNSPSKRVSAEADPNCLGTVTISSAKMIRPFGEGNENCFLGLWLNGVDYPQVMGTPAVQKNDVFTYIGAPDNYSHMTLNGATITQEWMDVTMNFYTYYPVIAMGLIGSGLMETITIDSQFRIPSAAAFRNEAPTYYVLDRAVELSKPSSSFSIPQNNTWSDALRITSTEVKNLGTATFAGYHAYYDFDPNNANDFVMIPFVGGTDYSTIGSVNQAFAGVAKDDFKTMMKINGKPLTEYSVSDGLINKWAANDAFGFVLHLPSGMTVNDFRVVEVLPGMRLPSANGIDYYAVKAHYVFLPDDYPYTDITDVDSFVTNYLNNSALSYEDIKAEFNSLSAYLRHIFCNVTEVYADAYAKLDALVSENGESIEDNAIESGKELGSITMASLKSINRDGSANEYLCISFNEDVDYPTTSNVQISESKLGILRSTLKYLEFKDSSDSVVNVSLFDAYINLNDLVPSLCLGLNNLSSVQKIKFKTGMNIPSYAFLTGDKENESYGFYSLDESLTYYIVGDATHAAGVENDWQLPVVTVVYLSESGDTMNSYPNEKVECGSTYTLKGVPEKVGHSGYWSVVEPAGIELDGLSFKAPSNPCTITLRASYTARSYSLSFEGITAEPVVVTYGVAIGDKIPAVPEKVGYENGRWVVEGTTISSDYVWNFASDKTATAEYDVSKYTVTFNTGDGSKVDSQIVNYNETATRPANPVREGYAFVDWYESENAATPFDFTTKIVADLTLYARWEVCYTVTFDTDGGSLISSVSVRNGETVARPEFNPTKEGFTFVGWYLNDVEFDFDTPITMDITLKAHYKKDASKGCAGSITMTSVLLSLISFTGIGLLVFTKKKEN